MSITKDLWNYPQLRSANNAKIFDGQQDTWFSVSGSRSESKTFRGFGAVLRYLMTDRDAMISLNFGMVVTLFLAAILVPAIPGVSLVVADMLIDAAATFACYLIAAWWINLLSTSLYRTSQAHWFYLLNLAVGILSEASLLVVKLATSFVTVPLDLFNLVFGLAFTKGLWRDIKIGSLFSAVNTPEAATSINITLLSGLFLSLIFSNMMPPMVAFGLVDATIAFGTYLLCGVFLSELTTLPLHLVPAIIGVALEGAQLAVGSVLSIFTLSADLVSGTIHRLNCCVRRQQGDLNSLEQPSFVPSGAYAPLPPPKGDVDAPPQYQPTPEAVYYSQRAATGYGATISKYGLLSESRYDPYVPVDDSSKVDVDVSRLYTPQPPGGVPLGKAV